MKPNKRDSQIREGMERGASLADWQAAVEAKKSSRGGDEARRADAVHKALKRTTERLMKANATEIAGDMITVKSGPGGENMMFGTAEEDFMEEHE